MDLREDGKDGMQPEVLVTVPLARPVMEALNAAYVLHRLWEAADPDALLANVGPGVRGCATSGGKGASAALIAALPRLEIIACYGVGVDAVDLAAARARGVAVTNTPDVLTDDVADLAIGLMLAVLRRIAEGDRYVRAGRWLEKDLELGWRVSGRRLGILGLGRIGKAVARRALAFGMTVAYCGRHEQKDQPYRYIADLADLARESDVLVLTCPGGPATRGIVDARVLEALGPEGVLVNVARGSVVDEPALVAALAGGRLRGAGLDVFADEPRVPEALFGIPTVVVQPHQASATHETRGAMGALVVENLRRHFAGEPLATPV
jgi:lactate dehydrogenase-like 2-hydroxyacid dehydrogenase